MKTLDRLREVNEYAKECDNKDPASIKQAGTRVGSEWPIARGERRRERGNGWGKQ